MADTVWRQMAWYSVEGGGTLYLQLIDSGIPELLDRIGMYLQQIECPARLKLVGTLELPIRPPEETPDAPAFEMAGSTFGNTRNVV